MKNRIMKTLSSIIDIEEKELLQLPPSTHLSDLGLESIQFIQLIVALEDEFQIEILDSDLMISNFKTIEILFQTIKKYLSQETASKKVLVCDCDNVLWHGVAGEEELSIDGAVLSFQQELFRLYEHGVLLCLCSRNEAENIEDAFRTLAMPLKQEHFICARINRQNKASNLRDMAAELNLSLDSFVFVDDSDYELGLIQALLPEVETVKAEYDNLRFVDQLNELFGQQASQDINRTQLYREQKEREKSKCQFATVEEYNRSLGTNCTCTIATQEQVDRIVELSQRTNQCNLSATRYTKQEVVALLSCEEYRILSLAVTDIYGDMGVVGAAVVRLSNQQAVIESFFLSCRAFDRGFEADLLDKIKAECGGKALYGVYRSTSKNRRYQSFYTENGVSLYE